MGFLRGPTGHSFKVDDHFFQTAYTIITCKATSFISLKAKGTIQTVEKFGKEVEVIGHYHDGNTLAVKRHLLES